MAFGSQKKGDLQEAVFLEYYIVNRIPDLATVLAAM